MSRKNLTPPGRGGWLLNFVANFFWSIVWLGRSIIKIVKKKL